MMTEQQLLDLKIEVEEAKATTAELKGQQTALMNQLRTDWKCNSVEEAEKKLKTMQKEIETLDKKIREGVAEVEKRYNNI